MRVLAFATIAMIVTVVTNGPIRAAQTDAPKAEASNIDVTVVASGLSSPWGLDFLPDGRMLVSEKDGNLRIIAKDGKIGTPIAGVPEVMSRGQGGLLDVRVAPDFAETGTIYFSFAEPRGDDGNGTSTARAKLTLEADSGKLSDLKIIFRQQPAISSGLHFGSRIVFDKDGNLFITTGERGSQRDSSQDLSTQLGKVIRITPEGSPAPGNPFIGEDGKDPMVWSYGHRNIQGAVMDPATGTLWVTEHGPRGGDELNRVEAGKNYGWPVITYGINYDGSKVSDIQAKDGMEQPVYYWVPSIATSGLEIYSGDLFRDWKGNLLAGGMAGAVLERLVVENGEVVAHEPLLTGRGDRVRTVRQGPEGAVWVLTDSNDGQLLKLTPAE